MKKLLLGLLVLAAIGAVAYFKMNNKSMSCCDGGPECCQ